MDLNGARVSGKRSANGIRCVYRDSTLYLVYSLKHVEAFSVPEPKRQGGRYRTDGFTIWRPG